MEQIEAELKRVRELHGKPKKIFLGDGNAFGLKTEKLYEHTTITGSMKELLSIGARQICPS